MPLIVSIAAAYYGRLDLAMASFITFGLVYCAQQQAIENRVKKTMEDAFQNMDWDMVNKEFEDHHVYCTTDSESDVYYTTDSESDIEADIDSEEGRLNQDKSQFRPIQHETETDSEE